MSSRSPAMQPGGSDVQASSTGGGETVQKRKRRRRPRRARPASGAPFAGDDSADDEDAPAHPHPVPSVGLAQAGVVAAPAVPRRIIDWSDRLSRSEDALRRALVITLLGGPLDGELELIRATIALRFEIDETRLTLHPWGLSSFLLILPNEELAGTIYNGGRPFVTNSVRLHIMRWTRFIQASVASLSLSVEVELRGIPAHAWDLTTAEVLLDELCWIDGVHPSNADHCDVFMVKAWCSDPALFPPEMTLEIVEPPMADGFDVRTLTYPIKVTVRPLVEPGAFQDPPSPPPEDDDRVLRWKRRNSTSFPSSSSTPAAGAGEAPSSGQAGRTPVHSRLGPRIHAAAAARDPSSTAVLDIEDRSEMSAGASRGLEADRSGPEATVNADDTVSAGSLPEAACTRADEIMESVGMDTTVDGKKDIDVGWLDDIVRPRIEIPLELSCGPPMCPAAEDTCVGPQLLSSGPPLIEAHALAELGAPTPASPDVPAETPVISAPVVTPVASVPPAETSPPPKRSTPQQPLSFVAPHPTAADMPPPATTAPTILNPTASPRRSSLARAVTAAAPQTLRVYSRRHPRRQERAAHSTAAAQPSPSEPPSPATEFVMALTKVPGGILPIPHVNKRRKKAGATQQGASTESSDCGLPRVIVGGMPPTSEEASHACSRFEC